MMNPETQPQSPTRPVRQRARIRDVAQLAGVDLSVVSRILRDDPNISVRPETRQRILGAARTLDYRANVAARSLKTARTMAIGLLIPDLANPAAASIVRGAEEQALATGHLLLVATGSITDRLRALEDRVDGLLIASAHTSTAPLFDPERSHVPMLFVNRREPGSIGSVVVDDDEGARLAVRYLVSLGHRHIGHIAGPQNTDTGRRRRAGFEYEMRQAGLELRPDWIAEGPYNEAGGCSAAQRILRETPGPTALFVSNLLATVGAMAAARRLALTLPHELSLITFDDVALAAYLDPPVTTIRLPLIDVGRQAVNAILSLLDGGSVGDIVIDTAPELVIRGSAVPAG